MTLPAFSLSLLPRIFFGEGSLNCLPRIIRESGSRILLFTGGAFLKESPVWDRLQKNLHNAGIDWAEVTVANEPSPQLVDATVGEFKKKGIAVVVGIGGGSVLDAAKAVAGLLLPGNSVLDHLEGLGVELPYQGPAVPFIAIPTTAGTGSEATKNAVLSVRGERGFKRSFRSDLLVARYALVDPDLLASCPPALIAASGMDAVTQLIESYVSLRSNPFTDSLALGALEKARTGLLNWYDGGEDAGMGRNAMAYAAMVSGLTLAQAGLGAVHGLASPLGAFFPVPHGVLCGTLAMAVAAVNIRAMQERDTSNPALSKYARLGALLTERPELAKEPETALEELLNTLARWTDHLQLPCLGALGIQESDLPRIIAQSRGSSMKTNPIMLTAREIEQVLRFRM